MAAALEEKPKAEAGDWTGGGGCVALADEKFIPPNASASPPNASCFGAVGEAIALNDV